MGNRFLKQLLYGSFYLLIIFGLVGGVYYFSRPVATCFDNIQNGTETGIDCGGSSCVVCAVKNLKPVIVLSVNILPTADNLSTLVATIRNPNNSYGLSSFTYDFILPSSGEVIYSGTSWLYPGETRYLIAPAISTTSSSKLNLLIHDTSWLSRSEFTPPLLGYSNITNKIEGNFIVINGLAINQSATDFTNIIIGALLKNNLGQLVGASKTILPELTNLTNQPFRITHPIINSDLSRTELFISARPANLSGIKFDL